MIAHKKISNILLIIMVFLISGCATVTNTNPPARQQIYIVKRGDTLDEIAQKLTGNIQNSSFIAKYNGISDPNKIREGQTIIIPDNLSYRITQTTSSGTNSIERRATVEGGFIGALIGGTIGYFVAGDDHRLEGAIAGGLAGGVAGALVGREIDKRKAEYASTEDFYDAQIAKTAKLNQQLSRNNQNLRRSVRNNQKKINTLVTQYNAGKRTKNELVVSKQNVDQDHNLNRQKLIALQQELDVQKGVLEEMRQKGQTQRANALQNQISQLEREIASLQQTVDQMASQSATLGRYI